MLEYGRNVLTTTGRAVMVIADGDFRGMKSGGITLYLPVIPVASGSPVTLLDDTVVPVGAAYLRFGQIMTKITSGQQIIDTISGTPTGGTFTITVGGQTTAGIAYNAAASAVTSALVALSTVGAGGATTTGSTGGPYTITFAGSLGSQVITTSGASLTGGSSPASAITVTTAVGSNFNYFGPFDPAAVDGRQTLTRGECFILNRTWVDYPASFIGQSISHPAVFDTGRVWKERIIQSGVATHTLAAGPTLAEFETAFPGISYVEN